MTDFHPSLTATASVQRDHVGQPIDSAKFDSAHIRFHVKNPAGRTVDIGFARAVIVPDVRTNFDLRSAAGGSATWWSDLAAGIDPKYGDIGAVLIAAALRGNRDVVIIRDLVLGDAHATATIIRTALHAISTSFIARNAALIVADTDGWYTELPEDPGWHWWAYTPTGVIIRN